MRALTILAVLGSCGVCRGGLLTDFAASYALYQQCAMNGADFDTDLDIDGRDYLQWQRGLGSVGQFMNVYGDADRNGYVNQLDLNHWGSQFGGDLTGLPESECFKLFLEPEGIISGSATLVIDVPNPSPGQNRLAFGTDTRIIDVHPQYTAQVVIQNIQSFPGRQRLEVNVAFTANNPANPPTGPLTLFGFQAPDLMPQLGPGGVLTSIEFRPGNSVSVFDTTTGVTTTFDESQLIDVAPQIKYPLTLEVNTVTGNVRMRNPASQPGLVPTVLKHYEITSLGGGLSPTGWISIHDTEIEPPGIGWEEGSVVNAFSLSETNLNGSLELGNGQSQALGNAYMQGRGGRDLRFFYTSPEGALIPGEVHYFTPGPAEPVPEPNGLSLAVVATAWAKVRRRRTCV